MATDYKKYILSAGTHYISNSGGDEKGGIKGGKVRHNGDVWESTVDANVWEPGVYGWAQTNE